MANTFENSRYFFLHRLDEHNPGDLWSCPAHYFNLPGPICDNKKKLKGYNKHFETLILGGGDILSKEVWLERNTRALNNLNFTRKIAWGVGCDYSNQNVLNYIKDYNSIGIRNYSQKYPNQKIKFLPCVSVLNKIFDQKFTVDKNVTVIDHFMQKVETGTKLSIDQRVRNKKNTLINIVKAIGESNTIITNSYHVTYWSMIMNKRVIVQLEDQDNAVNKELVPKLTSFKYKPQYFYRGNLDTKILKDDFDYSRQKEEFRDLNLDFFKQLQI